MGTVTPEYIKSLHAEKESWRKKATKAELTLDAIRKAIGKYADGDAGSATDALNRINRLVK